MKVEKCESVFLKKKKKRDVLERLTEPEPEHFHIKEAESHVFGFFSFLFNHINPLINHENSR